MSEGNRLRVAVIVGSTHDDWFAPVSAYWISEQARVHGDFEVDVIDLLEERLPVVPNGDDPHAPLPDEVMALAPRIEAADAFVVVTAVYNRGYPASPEERHRLVLLRVAREARRVPLLRWRRRRVPRGRAAADGLQRTPCGDRQRRGQLRPLTGGLRRERQTMEGRDGRPLRQVAAGPAELVGAPAQGSADKL